MSNPTDRLNHWRTGHAPTATELQRLAVWELADSKRAEAFGITPENAEAALEERSQLFVALVPKIAHFPLPGKALLDTLWRVWLPLALYISRARRSLQRPLVQGITGVQGTGKTTMTQAIALILQELGYTCLCLSIDDLYKTYADRQALQRQDPRLIWRGPPGTHDVELGIEVLQALRSPHIDRAIAVPRFDKSAHNGAGDRTEPEWVTGADVILFEGWFVGMRPLASLPDELPPPILTPSDRAFAWDCNQRLRAYLPLWAEVDRAIALVPTDYRHSLTWRKQAEQQMRASGKPGMSDAEVEQFVRYFWKALHPELYLPPLVRSADLVLHIHPDRTVGSVYSPR